MNQNVKLCPQVSIASPLAADDDIETQELHRLIN